MKSTLIVAGVSFCSLSSGLNLRQDFGFDSRELLTLNALCCSYGLVTKGPLAVPFHQVYEGARKLGFVLQPIRTNRHARGDVVRAVFGLTSSDYRTSLSNR